MSLGPTDFGSNSQNNQRLQTPGGQSEMEVAQAIGIGSDAIISRPTRPEPVRTPSRPNPKQRSRG